MGAGDLADLLRELKERSGLSYGALAKRLHVSTSTLHRYVKGTAVPTEFAPLERLARVCGASREEMVEVHRRWILADALRGDRESLRGAASGGAGAAGAAGAPGSGGSDGSDGSDGSEAEGSGGGGAGAGGAGAGAGADAPVAGGSVSGGAVSRGSASDVPGSAGSGSAGSGSVGSSAAGSRAEGPHPRPERGDDDGDAPDIVIGRPPAPAPAPADTRMTRRLPRARVLVAAGVVFALGATAVAVQAASDGNKRDRASVNSPTEKDGEWGQGPSGAESVSPSKEPPGKASDKDKDKAGKGTTGSEDPKSEGKAGEDKNGGAPGTGDGGKGGGGTGQDGVPVSVSTQPYYWDGGCPGVYLVDKSPTKLSPPPGEQDAPAWAAANGAVAARDQTVRFTVQGKGKEAVVLESLNLRVAGSGAPLAWNNFKTAYLGVGCGSGVPKHSFSTDLDAASPRLKPEDEGDSFPYKVSANDAEAFYVNATVNNRFVRWYLELTWSSGGRHGTIRVDDQGKPFATSGDKSRPVYAFSLNSKKWTRTNRDNDDVPDPPA